MFCPHCAAPVEDNAVTCPQCGNALPQLTAASQTPEVKDYLILNIVLLVVSCLWISCMPAMAAGILGVVFASQVKSLVKEGKIEQAQEKSKWAKILAIITGVLLAATVLFLVFYFIFFFAVYGITFGAMFAELFSTLSMLAL